MRFTTHNTYSILCIISSLASTALAAPEPPGTGWTFLGVREARANEVEAFKRHHNTLQYLGPRESSTEQLGNGIYAAEKKGDWDAEEYAETCYIWAKTESLGRAMIAAIPEGIRSKKEKGKKAKVTILWDDPKAIDEYLENALDLKPASKVIRIGFIDGHGDAAQICIPGEALPSLESYVECVPKTDAALEYVADYEDLPDVKGHW